MVYGFQISMAFHENSNTNFEHFLTEALEANGLSFGGSSDGGFVTANDGNTTEDHRDLVMDWLTANGAQSINVDRLVYANV